MRYDVNGKTYTQAPLVLGQIGPLATLLSRTRILGTDPLSLIAALGGSLPEAMAIVLTPEGVHPADKDLDAVRRELYDMAPDTAIQVVSDFFVCNPLPSLLERLAGLIATLRQAPEPPGLSG
jgi:hypothetical protein